MRTNITSGPVSKALVPAVISTVVERPHIVGLEMIRFVYAAVVMLFHLRVGPSYR
jgi:hypothetical protein